MMSDRFRWAVAVVLPPTLLLAALLCSRPSSTARAQGGGPEFVPGQLLVQFKPGATESQQQDALARVRPTRRQKLRAPGLFLVDTPRAVGDAMAAMAAHGAVDYVQPNYVYHAIATPNDTRFANGELWALNNTGQSAGTADADIDAPEAWDMSTGASNVVVGVIDTGVDYTHPDLAANIWTNPGETPGNNVDDDGNGYVDDVRGWDAYSDDGNPLDDNSHGTHVAGTIGGVGNNGAGVVGINWNVKIVAAKFLGANGSGTTAGAIESIDYFNTLKDAGVNIVATNNSYSGGPFETAMRDAIERANAHGILFVAAAGNGNFLGQPINNDSSPQYPASYTNANVIAVTATDRNDRRASWANYGATSVDLGAPGVSIWSTTPNGAYASKSGTSMAAPHVTGAVALLKAYAGALTPAEIKTRILSTGDPIADLSGRTVSGRRLNIKNALNNFVPSAPTPPPPPALPAAPSSLTATAFSSSQINLAWRDNSNNETGFQIHRSTNGYFYSQIATVGAGATAFANPGLQASRRYYYRVRATSAAGNSGYSNTANAQTLP